MTLFDLRSRQAASGTGAPSTSTAKTPSSAMRGTPGVSDMTRRTYMRRRPPGVTSPRNRDLRQLLARGDAELLVDVPQVVLDGLRTQEDRRGRLAGGLAVGQEARDLALLRRQLIECRRVATARGCAGRRQLGAGLIGPRRRAEALERLERRVQLVARADALARAPQARPVGQPRARGLEHVRRPRVQLERPLEARLHLVAVGPQPAAALRARQRPRLSLLVGCGEEGRKLGSRRVGV